MKKETTLRLCTAIAMAMLLMVSCTKERHDGGGGDTEGGAAANGTQLTKVTLVTNGYTCWETELSWTSTQLQRVTYREFSDGQYHERGYAECYYSRTGMMDSIRVHSTASNTDRSILFRYDEDFRLDGMDLFGTELYATYDNNGNLLDLKDGSGEAFISFDDNEDYGFISTSFKIDDTKYVFSHWPEYGRPITAIDDMLKSMGIQKTLYWPNVFKEFDSAGNTTNHILFDIWQERPTEIGAHNISNSDGLVYYFQYADGYGSQPPAPVGSCALTIHTLDGHGYIMTDNGHRADGTIKFALGSTVTLTVVPNDSSFAFDGWTDGNTDNPRTIVVSEPREYVAKIVSTVDVMTTLVGTKWSCYGYNNDGIVVTGSNFMFLTGNTGVYHEFGGGSSSDRDFHYEYAQGTGVIMLWDTIPFSVSGNSLYFDGREYTR